MDFFLLVSYEVKKKCERTTDTMSFLKRKPHYLNSTFIPISSRDRSLAFNEGQVDASRLLIPILCCFAY